ncbi:MAG: GNAT family N-acetyltransferase, partial [Thermoplasmata archaeon]|nr:GNAT family N-acetyltransferase [Thermoplasmata archaeon]
TVLCARPERHPVRKGGATVRTAGEDDLDLVAGLWTEARGKGEVRRAIDVLWNHPNPDEAATPLLAEIDGRTVGGGVVYEHGGVAGLHGIGTVAATRGKGVATALVTHALSLPSVARCEAVVLGTDSSRAIAHLEPLGFAVLQEYAEYELPVGAELDLPDPGPPQPPRWRPPRSAGAG